MIDDLYKNCRWCHWYIDGECVHDKTFESVSTDISYLSEDGIIEEAIIDAFSEQGFSELKSHLESLLSKKKANEVMQAFFEELKAVKDKWAISIDEAVTAAINNEIGGKEKCKVVDPEDFYCKYFM